MKFKMFKSVVLMTESPEFDYLKKGMCFLVELSYDHR